MKILGSMLLIWNTIVFFVYGADKLCARKHMRRISEATLITIAFLLGGIGAMFGMVMFNHKTSKLKFRIFIPLSVFLNVAMAVAVVYYLF